MISGTVVFYKIATTCLLILVGYIGRRMKLLPEISSAVVSRYLLYIALPCYLVYYMSASVSRDTLGAYWYFPILGAGLMAVSDLFGYAVARIWAKAGERATFRMLAGLPNWMFMALAVIEPLFGEEGLRLVLLFNVGITFYLWTFGMTGFRPAIGWRLLLRELFLNTQTVALGIGFALAMLFPFLKGMEALGADELAALPLHLGVISPVWETMFLVSETALPLSIMQIGLILGETRRGEAVAQGRTLALVVFLRLLVGPILVMAALALLRRLGLPLSGGEFVAAALVFAMPSGVTAISVSDMYGGVVRLAARVVLWSTLASMLTAQIMTWAAQWAHQASG